MSNIKIFLLMAFAVVMMTACSAGDNPVIEDDVVVEVTENFSPEAGTRILTLEGLTGSVVIGEQAADWVTVIPAANDGAQFAQVEISVQANETAKERSAVQAFMVNEKHVKLTVNQGCVNVDDPFEQETDQPAFSPEL